MSGGSATILAGQTGDHYTGCAADAAGNVYGVSIFKGLFPNAGTGSIVKVDANGAVSTLSGTESLFLPNMIAVGPSGALYVSVGSICTTVAHPNPCGGLTGSLVKITP